MPTTRRRRIVRRAVMAMAGVVLLVISITWLVQREPPEIQRSRALRIGMTSAEVEAVMGQADGSYSYMTRNGNKVGLLFGRTVTAIFVASDWLGLEDRVSIDWPVRVGFDANDRVEQIVRGDEVEPQQ